MRCGTFRSRRPAEAGAGWGGGRAVGFQNVSVFPERNPNSRLGAACRCREQRQVGAWLSACEPSPPSQPPQPLWGEDRALRAGLTLTAVEEGGLFVQSRLTVSKSLPGALVPNENVAGLIPATPPHRTFPPPTPTPSYPSCPVLPP